jgi:hypothetical protein
VKKARVWKYDDSNDVPFYRTAPWTLQDALRDDMTDIGPKWIQWPYARIRRELEVEEGTVSRFVYQVEYDVAATPAGTHTPNWKPVARFDHNTDPSTGHDIRKEGLHLDLYRDEEKHRVVTGFPPVSLSHAPAYCERYLEKNAPQLLEQFEYWHNLTGPWRIHSSSE